MVKEALYQGNEELGELAEKLARLKKRHRLTTRELSSRSGVPIGTLNKLLDGTTRKPSLETMERVAQVFHVPIRYFAEDQRAGAAKGEGQTTRTQTEQPNADAQETRLLERFRQLTPQERRVVERMLDATLELRSEGEGGVLLPCYRVGDSAAGAIVIRKLRVKADPVAQNSDFAIEVLEDRMEPGWRQGTLLGVRGSQVEDGEIGVFFLGGIRLLRRFVKKNGAFWLESLAPNEPDFLVEDWADLRHMGVVLGELVPLEEKKTSEHQCHSVKEMIENNHH